MFSPEDAHETWTIVNMLWGDAFFYDPGYVADDVHDDAQVARVGSWMTEDMLHEMRYCDRGWFISVDSASLGGRIMW